MFKTLSSIALAGLITASITGCSDKEVVPGAASEEYQCTQEKVLAPSWTCLPTLEGHYAGLGIAENSAAGMSHMRRVALANGRSDLAQQIQTLVKDKVEVFTRSTGNGAQETVDKVSTAVTKQVAKVDLQGSKAVDVWSAPSGALYMLVAVNQSEVNREVKKAVSSSLKNDDALWQQFQSKQSLE
ncbi:MAG: LPP20 family lipoprotein, partial [Sulfurimonas sp.]|nr:LPP20 family lipoprotein [Sulfurimonas sp.]